MLTSLKSSKPRQGGRNAYQAEQKRRTRETILAAAGRVFSQKPYSLATIDEIIREAGISRVTFYMHFETKLALAFAIWDEIMPDWLCVFDALAGIAPGDVDALADWVNRLCGVYVDHGYISALVVQLDFFEDEFHHRVRDERDRLIDHLAATLPAFTAATGTGPDAVRNRARAHLILQRIDQMCSELTLHGPVPDSDIYIRLLAEELSDFLAGDRPARQR